MVVPKFNNFPTPGRTVKVGILDSFLNVGNSITGQLAKQKPYPAALDFDGIRAVFPGSAMLRRVGFIIARNLGKIVTVVTPFIGGVCWSLILNGEALPDSFPTIVTIDVGLVDVSHGESPMQCAAGALGKHGFPVKSEAAGFDSRGGLTVAPLYLTLRSPGRKVVAYHGAPAIVPIEAL